jgi:dihydrofolate synthase / folylpolyglutamate synthase
LQSRSTELSPSPPSPPSLDAWLEFIGQQHSAEIVMGLERVREVWTRMGKPQAPRNIVVGGTNGKGSTCAMLVSVLHISGYRTGFYSSPHLVRYNERVRILQQEVDDARLCASFAAVEAARVRGEVVPLTYFEFATLSALCCFAEAKLDLAILEVGLGGRLDAVNLIDADVAILTSVDLDHQQYLGDTREKIGWEKAHIARAARPIIYADPDMPSSVEEVVGDIGARLYRINRDYRVVKQENQWQWLGSIEGRDNTRHALPIPALRGRYQLNNAAAALAALAALSDGLPISATEVKRGLLEVEWPGRMQVLRHSPTRSARWDFLRIPTPCLACLQTRISTRWSRYFVSVSTIGLSRGLAAAEARAPSAWPRHCDGPGWTGGLPRLCRLKMPMLQRGNAPPRMIEFWGLVRSIPSLI